MNLPDHKQAGVCLHLTSLPGRYGIGELGAAAHAFIDTLVAMNISVWQILPTGPTAYGDSPYQPLSAFAGNELLIDIDNLLALNLLQPTDVAVLCDLSVASVDYGALIPRKNTLLAQAADNFARQASAELKAEFSQFISAHDQRWLHDYALFRALKNLHEQRPWSEWAAALSHREGAALQKFSDRHERAILQIKILQFLFYRQWAALRAYAHERGITLFGDMPIYIAHDSAEAWSHPELLLTDAAGQPEFVAGVPPDYFSADGQLWGNPLYAWDYHASNGFAWWVERLTHASAMTDLTRIDHFRGFESYWSVPAAAPTAQEGSWEPGPGDALFDAVRAALGDLPIVAEDLGIITPAVDQLRERQNIPGMRVLQFDLLGEDFDLNKIAAACVCYTGTHDNDTTLGWFRGGPEDSRSAAKRAADQVLILERTQGHADSIHFDVIRMAFASNARLAIAPLQDYLGLGSEARLNRPGTSENNWRWRVQPDQLSPSLLDEVGELTTEYGRVMSR